jgi:hypothetical protein
MDPETSPSLPKGGYIKDAIDSVVSATTEAVIRAVATASFDTDIETPAMPTLGISTETPAMSTLGISSETTATSDTGVETPTMPNTNTKPTGVPRVFGSEKVLAQVPTSTAVISAPADDKCPWNQLPIELKCDILQRCVIRPPEPRTYQWKRPPIIHQWCFPMDFGHLCLPIARVNRETRDLAIPEFYRVNYFAIDVYTNGDHLVAKPKCRYPPRSVRKYIRNLAIDVHMSAPQLEDGCFREWKALASLGIIRLRSPGWWKPQARTGLPPCLQGFSYLHHLGFWFRDISEQHNPCHPMGETLDKWRGYSMAPREVHSNILCLWEMHLRAREYEIVGGCHKKACWKCHASEIRLYVGLLTLSGCQGRIVTPKKSTMVQIGWKTYPGRTYGQDWRWNEEWT